MFLKMTQNFVRHYIAYIYVGQIANILIFRELLEQDKIWDLLSVLREAILNFEGSAGTSMVVPGVISTIS